MLIYNAVRGCQGDAGVSSWADHTLDYNLSRISGQNANDRKPTPKPQIPKMLSPTSKLQTQKSVAFHTLAFCLWHHDRIPLSSHY